MTEVFDKHITLYDWQDFCYRHNSCTTCTLVGPCRIDTNPRAWNIEDIEDKIRAGMKAPKKIIDVDTVLEIIESMDDELQDEQIRSLIRAIEENCDIMGD